MLWPKTKTVSVSFYGGPIDGLTKEMHLEDCAAIFAIEPMVAVVTENDIEDPPDEYEHHYRCRLIHTKGELKNVRYTHVGRVLVEDDYEDEGEDD